MSSCFYLIVIHNKAISSPLVAAVASAAAVAAAVVANVAGGGGGGGGVDSSHSVWLNAFWTQIFYIFYIVFLQKLRNYIRKFDYFFSYKRHFFTSDIWNLEIINVRTLAFISIIPLTLKRPFSPTIPQHPSPTPPDPYTSKMSFCAHLLTWCITHKDITPEPHDRGAATAPGIDLYIWNNQNI